MDILGIDIGGSGIKGAIVDVEKGELLTERHRIPTPNSATPYGVSEVISQLMSHFQWNDKIGCGFPAAIVNGVVKTASNIDKSWLDKNIIEYFNDKTGCLTNVVNDADAAGLAEMEFGAGKNRYGVVIIVTVGTGLGTSIFTDRVLLPNTGLTLHDRPAEEKLL